MFWLWTAAVTRVIVISLASAEDTIISSSAFEQRILQEVGARMEQFGQQYISRIEQLQVSSTRTLTQVEDKLSQLQERARVWDTFQSVITTWTDLLVGTDRKMDLLKEGIERTAQLYGSISPYSAVAYQVEQLNVKLSRLLSKVPETDGGYMVKDFAIKGVLATLRELKAKMETMNRRRFVVKKVVNTDGALPPLTSGPPGVSDVQYRDIQDELDEAISSNNMLNAIEVKLDRIETVVTERLGAVAAVSTGVKESSSGSRGPGAGRGTWHNGTAPGERPPIRPRGGQVFKEPRPRLHGEPRGRRGGAADAGRGAVSCERLLKQWSQMELNFDQFDAVREAVGRMEDVLDYKTSTAEVKLDRLADLMYRQGSKLDKSEVSMQHNQDAILVRLKTLREQTAASHTATMASLSNLTERSATMTSSIQPSLEQTELFLRNISEAAVSLQEQTELAAKAADNSSRQLSELVQASDNVTSVYFDKVLSALDLLAALHRPPRPAPTAAAGPESAPPPSPPPTQLPPPPPDATPPGLRGCEDLAQLGMTSDVRYRFGDAFGPSVGLDYMERYCDMHTDGGGWTIIQRRNDFGIPKLNFSQPWKSYKHGFGDLDKEFWFGNENIHKLTNEQDVSLRVDLEDFEGNTAFAVYTKFRVSGEEDGYHLEVAGYHGNASDSLTSHNLSQFSTWDVTNDKAPPCCPCANAYGGGWWFNSCFESNLNGEYHMDPLDNDHYHGIIWELWKGDYSLKASEMKVRSRAYVRDTAYVAASETTTKAVPPLATSEVPEATVEVVSEPTSNDEAPPTSDASWMTAPATTVTTEVPTTPEDLGIEPLDA